MEADQLQGAGEIKAKGGEGRYGGVGGRIGIQVEDISQFTGSYSAASDSTYDNATLGAGTVYLKDQYGPHLYVDNEGQNSPVGGTPIRTVGQHEILSADCTNNTCTLTISGMPWMLSNPDYGFGIDGLTIDLDATDDIGPFYDIVTNTENTLTIETSDDLSWTVGQTLIGVHTFDTLTVKASAWLDLGSDRLVLTDPEGSTVDIDSTLSAGQIDPAIIDAMGDASGQIIIAQ